MSKEIITHNPEETKVLGKQLAEEVGSGGIVCLYGDLGAGKTTFTQGLLESLGAKGPYTSPTFVIMKEYKINDAARIYHVDAYRIGVDDLETIGWDEIVNNSQNIVIIEWPENIEPAIPTKAVRIHFQWLSENERKISYDN